MEIATSLSLEFCAVPRSNPCEATQRSTKPFEGLVTLKPSLCERECGASAGCVHA